MSEVAPHPLVRSLADASGATGWLRVLPDVPADPAGWVSCAALLRDVELLQNWVRETHQALTDVEGAGVPLVVPATYVMGWYLQVPATVGALLFHRARRVPRLAAEAVAVHRAPFGYVDAVALTSRSFTCLPDDPAATHPDATVVRDERALATTLRAQVVAAADAFHTVYRPAVKIGSRQRWGMVVDVLDAALWQAGQARGAEASGVHDARLVLDGAHGTDSTGGTEGAECAEGAAHALRCGSQLRPDARAAGGTRWTRRRLSCCFMFALPSAQVCSTCPRLQV